MACYDVQNSTYEEDLMAVTLDLTWQYPLSEFCPKQKKAVCVHQFTFHYGPLWFTFHYGPLWQPHNYIALIATFRSLITSFQLPLH